MVEYSDQKKSWVDSRHFQIGRRQNRQNFNVLWFQWKLISIFCFKRGPNRSEVYKRNMCINYFWISAHLSNSITSDNRDPNNALNSDMGVIWRLLCLHPNTIKPRLYLRLRKMSHTIYAANGKVSHIHWCMHEWDYTIDKSLVCLQSERRTSC